MATAASTLMIVRIGQSIWLGASPEPNNSCPISDLRSPAVRHPEIDNPLPLRYRDILQPGRVSRAIGACGYRRWAYRSDYCIPTHHAAIDLSLIHISEPTR